MPQRLIQAMSQRSITDKSELQTIVQDYSKMLSERCEGMEKHFLNQLQAANKDTIFLQEQHVT